MLLIVFYCPNVALESAKEGKLFEREFLARTEESTERSRRKKYDDKIFINVCVFVAPDRGVNRWSGQSLVGGRYTQIFMNNKGATSSGTRRPLRDQAGVDNALCRRCALLPACSSCYLRDTLDGQPAHTYCMMALGPVDDSASRTRA